MGPSVKPESGVTQYVKDKTQGPCCAIACGPATVFRNYFAEVGGAPEGQTADRQLDCLDEFARIIGNVPNGKFFEMKGGYTMASDEQLQKLDACLKQLEAEGRLDEARAAIRVGVVSDTQVTSAKW